MVSQAVHCTNPRDTIHADHDMSGSLLELENLFECQPCLRVSQKPQICVEDSLAGGGSTHAWASISLVQILDGQGYFPQDKGCELLLLWEQFDGGLSHCIVSLRMGGARAGGAVIGGAMGTKDKLFMLKLKGHVTWGHRAARLNCLCCEPSALGPGLLGEPGSAETSGSIQPLAHLRKMDQVRGGGEIHLHPHRLQGPAPLNQLRNHPRTQPTPKGPQAGHSWPQILPRISLLPRSQPLNSAELLSNSYR